MGILEGKTVLIIGASGEIGYACAEQCLAEGAAVCCTYRTNRERLDRLAEKSPGQVHIFRLDLSERANIKNTVSAGIAEVRGVDILLQCAGINVPELLFSANAEQWEQVISDNLLSVFSVMQAIIMPLMKRRGGAIINVSSVYGLKGGVGQSSYCASKAGVIGLTKAAAAELAGKNIRINAVCPGYIESAMTEKFTEAFRKQCLTQIPMKRFGTAQEVAELCVFLASGKASYITGQTFVIDGGLTI